MRGENVNPLIRLFEPPSPGGRRVFPPSPFGRGTEGEGSYGLPAGAHIGSPLRFRVAAFAVFGKVSVVSHILAGKIEYDLLGEVHR